MANPDDEYVEQIYQFVRKRLPDDIAAQRVTAAVFRVAARQRHPRDRERFLNRLYQIATNEVTRELRGTTPSAREAELFARLGISPRTRGARRATFYFVLLAGVLLVIWLSYRSFS